MTQVLSGSAFPPQGPSRAKGANGKQANTDNTPAVNNQRNKRRHLTDEVPVALLGVELGLRNEEEKHILQDLLLYQARDLDIERTVLHARLLVHTHSRAHRKTPDITQTLWGRNI